MSTLPERPRLVKLYVEKWVPYRPRSLPGRSAQRARAAFRALATRSSAVMLAALAGPPLRPPFLPSATAAGFLRLAMATACPSGHGQSRK